MKTRALLGFAVLAAAVPALADDAAPPPKTPEWRVDGSYRLRFAQQTDVPLDTDAAGAFDRLGQTTFLEQRLRFEPKVVAEHFDAGLQLDLLSGLLSSSPGLADSFDGYPTLQRSQTLTQNPGVAFRKLYLDWRSPVGLVSVGQMASEWGLGMLANSGDGEGNVDWGDKRFGDLVDRVLFATRPLALATGGRNTEDLVLALGADLVYSDATSQLLLHDANGFHLGDQTVQGLLALRWTRPWGELGAYGVRRHEQFRSAASDTLDAWIGDVYGRVHGRLGGLDALGEAEAAFVSGSTTYVRTLAAPTGTSVRQGGGVLRGTLGRERNEASLEVGFASGDTSPFDGEVTNFSFNRDYKVSLLLFDEVLAWQTARAAVRLADPNLVGQPPSGVGLLPTSGAVSNALYVKPTVRWRPARVERLLLLASVLYARAAAAPLDPYASFACGGCANNAFGGKAGLSYGWELDLGGSYHIPLSPKVDLELGAQGGLLLPGDAFSLPDGGAMPNIGGGRLRATLTWL